MELTDKLEILADAAKYDASCASSGRRNAVVEGQGRAGRHQRHGHLPQLYAGRPLRLAAENPADQLLPVRLPVLRQPPHAATCRAPASRSDEVVKLTVDFYLRNYIDGLFLSSGIIQSSRLHDGAAGRGGATLREEHQFRGYIHLKTIPDAEPELIAEAGRYADRLSVNIELPTDAGIEQPGAGKERAHHQAGDGRDPPQARRKGRGAEGAVLRAGRAEHADDRRRRRQTDDSTILGTAQTLYGSLQAQARVLLGLQPDPAKPDRRAAGAAADACASTGCTRPIS